MNHSTLPTGIVAHSLDAAALSGPLWVAELVHRCRDQSPLSETSQDVYPLLDQILLAHAPRLATRSSLLDVTLLAIVLESILSDIATTMPTRQCVSVAPPLQSPNLPRHYIHIPIVALMPSQSLLRHRPSTASGVPVGAVSEGESDLESAVSSIEQSEVPPADAKFELEVLTWGGHAYPFPSVLMAEQRTVYHCLPSLLYQQRAAGFSFPIALLALCRNRPEVQLVLGWLDTEGRLDVDTGLPIVHVAHEPFDTDDVPGKERSGTFTLLDRTSFSRLGSVLKTSTTWGQSSFGPVRPPLPCFHWRADQYRDVNDNEDAQSHGHGTVLRWLAELKPTISEASPVDLPVVFQHDVVRQKVPEYALTRANA